ncbi:MAG: sulfite exporter TauE/SafE family protein [Propionibacteriaceae bacterium]|nr:sulfite exporter TauE/SafE family protein [Propionibacteriaceae bacterium]
MELLAAVIVGVVIGVVLGTLGGGGAIITIPVLTYGFGLGFVESTTASLVIVGASSLAAVVAHARAGRVDWVRGAVVAGIGTVGAVLGAFLAQGLDPNLLLLAFGVLLVVVALLMLRRSRTPAGPAEPASLRRPRTLLATAAAGLAVGVLTGLLGVGGGFAIVPALTLVLGLPMRTAAATSLLVIGVNSAAALAAKVGVGVQLDWVLVATFTVATIGGSLLGARLAGRVDPATLKRAFAVLLLAVAAWTLGTTIVDLTR